VSGGTNEGCGDMTIPNAAILRLVDLTIPATLAIETVPSLANEKSN
jgi:hypothetical protein